LIEEYCRNRIQKILAISDPLDPEESSSSSEWLSRSINLLRCLNIPGYSIVIKRSIVTSFIESILLQAKELVDSRLNELDSNVSSRFLIDLHVITNLYPQLVSNGAKQELDNVHSAIKTNIIDRSDNGIAYDDKRIEMEVSRLTTVYQESCLTFLD
jgi:hypothetical protein